MSENMETYIIVGVTAVMLILGIIALFKLIRDEVSKEKAKKE